MYQPSGSGDVINQNLNLVYGRHIIKIRIWPDTSKIGETVIGHFFLNRYFPKIDDFGTHL